MTKPASFPFLAIAKRFNVPYGDVLEHAHRYRTYEGEFKFRIGGAIDNAIYDACLEFLNVQGGVIDWITGELSPDYGKWVAATKAGKKMIDAIS